MTLWPNEELPTIGFRGNKQIIHTEETDMINFKYDFTREEEPEFINSLSKVLGIIQPTKKETRKPPRINKTFAIASIVPRILVLNAEGIPIIKVNPTVSIDARFLFTLNLSIRVATGISSREIRDVIAAIYAKPKNKIATNLPIKPY